MRVSLGLAFLNLLLSGFRKCEKHVVFYSDPYVEFMIGMVDKTVALTTFNDSVRVFRTERFTRCGCGNKQFKLTKNLQALKQRGCTSVLSFGGLWSNHLHALSLACETLGLSAVAVVRGEETTGSALLNDAIEHGMKVHYVSRGDYRNRQNDLYVRQLMEQLGCDAWLPEGGSNDLAVEGCEAIVECINKCLDQSPTHFSLAVGTGATMAGIINACKSGQQVTGVPVVQDDRLRNQISRWVTADSGVNWQLLETAHPAKYGKTDYALLEFVLTTYDSTGMILDPVYNAKAFRSLLESGRVDYGCGYQTGEEAVGLPNSGSEDTVFIHTGGIGGCLGFSDQLRSIDRRTADRMLFEVRQLLGINA